MSEDAIRAARMMQSAAEDMQRAAHTIQESNQRLIEAMSWHNDAMDRHSEALKASMEPILQQHVERVGAFEVKTTIFGGENDPFIDRHTIPNAKDEKATVTTYPMSGPRPAFYDVCGWSYKDGKCSREEAICTGAFWRDEGDGQVLAKCPKAVRNGLDDGPIHCKAQKDGDCEFVRCPQHVEGNYKPICPHDNPRDYDEQ
jgi:hypothetical protein